MSILSSIHLAGSSLHCLVRGNVYWVDDVIKDGLDHDRPFVYLELANPSDPERTQVAVSPRHVTAIYPVS